MAGYSNDIRLHVELPCVLTAFCPLLRIGLAAAQALGKRGAHVVVSSRRQANVDRAVALLESQSIRVTGTTCNVGNGEDRQKLVQTVRAVRNAQLKVCGREVGETDQVFSRIPKTKLKGINDD